MDWRIVSIGTLSSHPLWSERGEVRTGHATTTAIKSGDAMLLVDPSLPPLQETFVVDTDTSSVAGSEIVNSAITSQPLESITRVSYVPAESPVKSSVE